MSNRVLRCDDGWNVLASRPGVDDARFFGTAFTLGNGYLATRGSCPELGDEARPATFLHGVYEKPAAEHKPSRLVICPDWLSFELSDGDGELTRGDGEVSDHLVDLNLRAGTLTRSFRWTGAGGKVTRLDITRLTSLDSPQLCGERFSITPENWSGELTFVNRLDGRVRPSDGEAQHSVFLKEPLEIDREASALVLGVRTREPRLDVVAVSTLRGAGEAEQVASPERELLTATHRCAVSEGQTLNLDRVVAYASSRDAARRAPLDRAARALSEAPFWEGMVFKHRRAWQRFWQQSGVEIGGDAESQWMVRFTMFHLWQCACENSCETDASIGARGIHGEGYSGHVFWDTETYMLPFFILSQPEVARALLMYRYRRLPAARRRARFDDGIDGARFPWESADTGEETTPRQSGSDQGCGAPVPILTGQQEIHITADVAYAVWSYYESTGDERFLLRYGAELLLDAARYWAGRLERQDGPDGPRYHISGVIGPDEYHESVTDNLYTNAMARWNLRRAAALGRELARKHTREWSRLARKLHLDEETLQRWEELAAAIALPFDEERQLYPQFKGFFELEDGRDRCAYRERWRIVDAEKLQIVKQPDVLLALHLLPELADQESFERHFDYFDPRTTHESSISPSMHALFAAHAGRPALGFDYLQKALALDCLSTAGGCDSGIHAANLGGVWKAVVMGFGGVSAGAEGLSVSPALPAHWTSLSFSLTWRGSRVHLQITHGEVIASLDEGEALVPLVIDGRPCAVVPGQAHVFQRRDSERRAASQE